MYLGRVIGTVVATVKAKKAGKIKHAGYSGDNQAAAYACELPGCDVIEISINYVDQNNSLTIIE